VSGETEANISGWTVDTLHTHFIRQLDLLRDNIVQHWAAEERARILAFNAQETAMKAALSSAEKAVDAALSAQEKAVAVANTANEKRLDSVNEFRGQQADILRVTMPRAEAEAVIGRATERIQELTSALAQTVTRSELEAQHVRDQERLAELGTRLTKVESLAQAAQANKAATFTALGAATALIVAVIVVLNFITSR
jgi:chromosome segregation ATPase